MILALLIGCGRAEEDTSEPTPAPGCEDAYSVTWESWGDGFFATYCRSCHSIAATDRLGAPAGVDFDTADDLLFWSDAVRRTVLEEQSMPVGGGVYEDDLLLLEMLLDCGI